MYGIIFILSTLFYWRQLTGVRCAATRILPTPRTPASRRCAQILALVVLCAGDGFAALVGARWGGKYRSRSLPWSRSKSWPGSGAFVVASVAFGAYFAQSAYQRSWTSQSLDSTLPRITLVALLAAFVESVSIGWDNVTVFIAVVVASSFLGLDG